MLNWSDGVKIPTDGPLRAYRASDGWYVVGEGLMCPVADMKEAQEMIADMKKGKK